MDQQCVTSRPMPAPGPAGAQPRPLGPLWLTASLLGIAAAAVLFLCFVAVIAFLALVATRGREGAAEFLDEIKFDTHLEARIDAAAVSILYIGVAGATLGLAVWRGRRRWPGLVALTPVGGRARREILVISAVTLAYASLSTWSIVHGVDRSLLISGPTDVLLVGLYVLNVVVLAPIAEELAFRGWLYTALRDRLAFLPSFLVTLLLFAAFHWDVHYHARVLQVLPLAIALGLLREAAGSIRPTIALHGAYNLIIVAIRLAYT